MNKSRKQFENTYHASKVVFALMTDDSPHNHLIGSVVTFKPSKHHGTWHKENVFEIVATQRVWGYDENGKYTMIDGVRVMALTEDDKFGCPANVSELNFLSTVN